MRQAWQHDADHGEVDPGLFAAGEQLIVLGEATPGGEPSERSFSYPPPLEHRKPLRPDLLPVSLDPFRDPDTTQAADIGCSTTSPSQPRLCFTQATTSPFLYALSTQMSLRRGKPSLSGKSRSLPP